MCMSYVCYEFCWFLSAIHTRYLVGLCRYENIKSNVMSPAAGTVPEDRKNDPGDKNINIQVWNLRIIREMIPGTSDDNRAETGAAGKPKLPHFLKVIISIGDAHMTIMELISAVSFFWLNCYRFLCKFASLWDWNQLAPKGIEESESAFQIFWSETNEPKENETWSLNFPIDNFLQRKQHSAMNTLRPICISKNHSKILWCCVYVRY